MTFSVKLPYTQGWINPVRYNSIKDIPNSVTVMVQSQWLMYNTISAQFDNVLSHRRWAPD